MSSLRLALAVGLFGAFLFSSCLYGQSGPCPTSHSTDTGATTPQLSADVICVVPQVYGPGGLVGYDHGGPLSPTESGDFKHTVHFRDAELASLKPLTAQIGTQLSQLPFTSPASGFLFSFNPTTGIQTATTQSFGPILSERADTIGKHKLFVGVSYQYFNFDRIDGTNLRDFGAVYQHEPETCVSAGPLVKPCEADGKPLATKDFLATTNRIDLKVHQITAVATFGLTNRLDFSVAIPILDVRMSMFSDVVIHSLEGSDPAVYDPSCPVCVHQFAPAPHSLPSGETLFSSDPVYGFNHASFSRASVATGIGDVVLRGKFEVIRAEKAGLAAGVDVRLPSGDAYNFLGSGTYGIRPFAAFSYKGRISPHASIGFQKNGDSVLAGDITNSTATSSMPNVFTFAFGADAAITKRISATADFLGQTLFNVTEINPSTYTNYCDTSGCPGVAKVGTFSAIASSSTTNVNQDSVALGGKINPFGRLLVTANVLLRVNDAGLHYKPVPLVGVSYTF